MRNGKQDFIDFSPAKATRVLRMITGSPEFVVGLKSRYWAVDWFIRSRQKVSGVTIWPDFTHIETVCHHCLI
jgi:hypothetical protein